MADKDLVYFQQGIPAGQQMDRYSNNPGMLLSKNADIFSSSNSYKATAFTSPISQADNVVATDERGRFLLYTSGKVEDTKDGSSWNASSRFDAINGGAKVNYYGPGYTNQYVNLAFGTPKSIVVKYDGDDWQEIVVFTDTVMFVKSKVSIEPEFIEVRGNSCTAEINGGIRLTDIKSKTSFGVDINLKVPGFALTRIGVLYYRNSANGDVQWHGSYPANYEYPYLYYDAPTDSMLQYDLISNRAISDLPTLEESSWKYFNTTVYTQTASQNNRSLELRFKLDTTDTVDSSNPRGGEVEIDWFDRITEYYVALPKVEDRIVKDIGEYYYISNGGAFPSLWNFSSEWVRRTVTVDGADRTMQLPLYTFSQFMGWEIPTGMTAVDCVVFDEKVYLICNQDGNGYIFPCDLSGGKGTPYIAYGVEFKSAIVLNYLIYLVGDNRGISTLFVYSGTELVHIIEGNKKADGLPDYIDNDEQYKFNGMMADWRGKLVLGTTDNRIFCYGQTYGGRGGSFIHSLASGQVLDSIKAVGKDLYIKYTEGGVVKTIKYQNDTAIKNYNTDFEIVYPVTIGSHLIEKEVYDLVCSYILPSSDCKLEFRLSVNHYYFRSFRIPSKPNLEIGKVLYLYSCVENYKYGLKLLEKNDEWYTFKLEGDLPIQNSYLSARGKLYERPDIGQETPMYEYTEFNHFRKIGEITSEGYEEGYYRNENINTKLECPRTHSVQLMVKGHGTANYTPEVFSVNLVSNQRHRG